MQISSVSSSSYASSSSSTSNSEVAALKKQKAELQKQLQEVNQSNEDSKTKQEKVKQIQQEIQNIDSQIQQAESEKTSQSQNVGQKAPVGNMSASKPAAPPQGSAPSGTSTSKAAENELLGNTIDLQA